MLKPNNVHEWERLLFLVLLLIVVVLIGVPPLDQGRVLKPSVCMNGVDCLSVDQVELGRTNEACVKHIHEHVQTLHGVSPRYSWVDATSAVPNETDVAFQPVKERAQGLGRQQLGSMARQVLAGMPPCELRLTALAVRRQARCAAFSRSARSRRPPEQRARPWAWGRVELHVLSGYRPICVQQEYLRQALSRPPPCLRQSWLPCTTACLGGDCMCVYAPRLSCLALFRARRRQWCLPGSFSLQHVDRRA